MLLEIKNLYFSHQPDQQLFQNFNLKVEEGKIIALAGESGCGKSTLLNLIYGLLDWENGDIIFNGKCTDKKESLYTIISILLPFKDSLIGFELDLKGIAISQGSACSSGAAKVSDVMHVLLNDEIINKMTPLRISLSRYNTKEEVDYLVNSLKEIEEKILARKK